MTNSEKSLRVTDSSCTEAYPQREHTIMFRGELLTVVFKYGVDTILPYEQALKFNVDGFKLHELDGSELAMPAVAKDNVKASLSSGEAVANLEELTLSSLKLRAAQKPGGEIYLEAGEDARADLIAFIKGEAPKTGADETAPVVVDGTEEDLIDDGEGEELGAMMAGKAPPASPVTETVMTPEVKTEVKTAEMTPEIKTSETLTAADVGTIEEVLGPSIAGEIGEISTIAGDSHVELESGAGSTDSIETERKFTLEEVKSSTDEALELAVKYGLSLEGVTGSGENGNVLKADVEAIIEQNQLKPVKAE